MALKEGYGKKPERHGHCPFCGHVAKTVSRSALYPDYRVVCSNQSCKAQGPQRRSHRGAVNAWKRHASWCCE